MLWKSMLIVVVAVGLGSLVGYYGQCSSGTCPLTSTWWRGAIYGGVMGFGFLFTMSKTRP